MRKAMRFKLIATMFVLQLNFLELKAEFLFDSYLIPSFDGQINTEYSGWDIFYSPEEGVNYPDILAPFGSLQTASQAGFTPPTDSLPTDPFAYWDTRNPTLKQETEGAFLTGSGNIYSFSENTDYTLNDTTSYTLGTVIIQFQTDGSFVDFDDISLIYNNGTNEVSLAPTEFIREYRNSSSAFGGTSNRNAVQWDLTGLGITQYRIEFGSLGSSMSLQQMNLDTAASYSSEVPEKRTLTTSGSQVWGTISNWQEGSIAQENGNVIFENNSSSLIMDSLSRTVGEMTFNGSDLTVQNSQNLVVNTGLTIPSSSNGAYTIDGNYELGAYNLFNIGAGTTTITGSVSGDYGFLKQGAGSLVLKGNNTFGANFAGISVESGTLRLEGTSTFNGPTSIISGDVVLATNAPLGAPGALGSTFIPVSFGASANFTSIDNPARIILDGDQQMAMGITFVASEFGKQLGTRNTLFGSRYNGVISFSGISSNNAFFAENTSDIVEFSSNISGGSASNTLEINPNGAAGTVVYSTTAKTYGLTTYVRGGTLQIESDSSVSGNVVIEPDASSLTSMLEASGSVGGSVTVGSGGIYAPGQSPGTASSGNLIFQSGGALQIEVNDSSSAAGTGWDLASVTGSLDIQSSSASPFIIDLDSLDQTNLPGLIFNFSSALSYTWTIVETTNGISGFSADKFLIDTSNFQNPLGAGTFTVEQSGDNLNLVFTPDASGFNTFLQTNFSSTELEDPQISGDSADFDNDGLSTIEEYAYDLNPKLADSSANTPAGSINDTDFGETGDEFLTVTFTRLLNRTDINYRVYAGDSPANLTTVVAQSMQGGNPVALNDGEINATTPSGNEQEITAADNTRVQDAPKRFMEVRIERP